MQTFLTWCLVTLPRWLTIGRERWCPRGFDRPYWVMPEAWRRQHCYDLGKRGEEP